MAKIQGQLENAQLENKSSDYSAGVAGRVWWNYTDAQVKSDDGTNVRAHLRNDGKIIIGNNGTAANNVRIHRGANGHLQFVLASDATAEGSLSNSIALLSSRIENYTTGARPAAGNAGRVIFNTTTGSLQLDNGVTWEEVGSGGSGGINFLTLDTSFLPNNTDNFNAEQTVGSWVAYADAAGAAPVDMTGGSPTVAISRTTTGGEVLNGIAGFKVVKDAANRQGEGVSCVANIPLGYRGQRAAIQMPFKITSGAIVGGDLKIFAYDVTNSTVLTLINNDAFVGSQGIIRTSLDIPLTCAQIRVGFHFATTSTTAVTFVFDDIEVGPAEQVYGTIVTDWVTYTITPTASVSPTKGTVDFDVAQWRRVGSEMEVRWTYRQSGAGGAGTGNYSFNLPSGYSIDTTKIDFNSGRAAGTTFGVVSVFSTTGSEWQGIVSNTSTANTNFSFFLHAGSVTGLDWMSATRASFGNAALVISMIAKFPIVGWATTSAGSTGSLLKVSNILTTRVTATPTALGQYRTYIKGAGAITGSDNAPSGTPTLADGMRIYAVNYATAGTSGQPNRWEIFVGKNKNVKFEFYSAAARTGWVDTTYNELGTAAFQLGLLTNYDPSTGVVLVDAINQDNTCTTRRVGYTIGTGGVAASPVSDCYFDVVVSENALFVEKDTPVHVDYTESTTSVPHNTSTTLIYPTKRHDTHGAYNTSTGVFTAPRTARYFISVTHGTTAITPAADTREIDVLFLFNGVNKREFITIFGSTTNYTYYTHAHFVWPMNAGDTLTVQLNQQSGATWVGSGGVTGQAFIVTELT